MLTCTLLGGGASLCGCVRTHRVVSAGQLGKIALLAVVFLASIVLGNVALQHIPGAPARSPARSLAGG